MTNYDAMTVEQLVALFTNNFNHLSTCVEIEEAICVYLKTSKEAAELTYYVLDTDQEYIGYPLGDIYDLQGGFDEFKAYCTDRLTEARAKVAVKVLERLMRPKLTPEQRVPTTRFIQAEEYRVNCRITWAVNEGEPAPDQAGVAVEWLRDIKADVADPCYTAGYDSRTGQYFEWVVEFWHPSHLLYQKVYEKYHAPEFGVHYCVPSPTEESSILQSKFLWRYVVRDVTGDEGTPSYVNKRHLGALKSILNRLDEYVRTPHSDGRCMYGGITKAELEAPLRTLIGKIERLGEVMVID